MGISCITLIYFIYLINSNILFEFLGNIHRHVVLGVYWNGLFGALGISR